MRTGQGQNQTWKAGAAAEIGDHLRALRHEPQELQRIGDMPRPDIGHTRFADQVHLALPFAQKIDESPQFLF